MVGDGRFQEARLITWDVTIYHPEHDIALLGHYTQTPPKKNKNLQSCSCTLPVALQKPRIALRSGEVRILTGYLVGELAATTGLGSAYAGNLQQM